MKNKSKSKSNILDKFDVKDFKNNFLGLIMKLIIIVKKNMHNTKYLIPLTIIAISLAIFSVVHTISAMNNLNKQSEQLLNLEKYNTNILKLNDNARNDFVNLKTVEDLFNYKNEVKDELDRYQNYADSLKIPYNNLLQYFYLPRLNIWKDFYLGSINTDLIGKKFLEENPYNDTFLLQKWSDFFKYVGKNNETNTITNITIGDIGIHNKNIFQIPITVDFIAHSKRSFLLLVDKLSLTSNEINIGLVNEFMYYLWQEIKKDKQNELKNISNDIMKNYNQYSKQFLNSDQTINTDKIIGFYLYNRINDNTENKLIDSNVLIQTAKNIVSCDSNNQDKCLYEFREKYRSIPNLAYMFNPQTGNTPVESLALFFRNFPPLLSIQSFTFDKVKNRNGINNNYQYEGKIVIYTYGKNISDTEVQEISLLLGEKCFNDEIQLTPEVSKTMIKKSMEKISSINKIDSLQSNSLQELNNIMGNYSKRYNNISNYEKIIDTFEIYRMLSDVNLCTAQY